MSNARPQLVISNRDQSTKLGFTPAVLHLRLPLGFHALGTPEKQRLVERELSRTATIVADKIASEVG